MASDSRRGNETAPSLQLLALREKRNKQRGKPNFKLQFQFIDGLGGQSERKKSRSHVTMQYYRRKRYEERRGPKLCSKGGRDEPFTYSDETIPEVLHTSRLETEKRHEYERNILEVTASSVGIGGGRVDPFASYPIEGSPEVHQLVDHYCYVIPSLVHTHWSRAIRKPRSCWDLFNLYRKDELSFLGMLHHSAHHLGSMRGYHQTMQSIKFKHQTLQGVNRKLADSVAPHDDGTMVAVGLLANGERLWGSREVARMHWSALKRMMLERGGFPSLKHDITLHSKLLWSFIALSWPASEGHPAYVEEFSKSSAAVRELAGASRRSAFRMSCDEFTQFVNQRKAQVLQQAAQRHQEVGGTQAQEDDGIVPMTTLSPALVPIKTNYSHPDKRRAVENCRMACLMFLNLILADHGIRSLATEKYFKELGQIIDDDDDDSTLTAEHLMWTLLSSTILPDHFDRCWKLSRLMGVVKEVGAGSWRTVEGLLLVLLAKVNSGDELVATLRSWNGNSFIEEAMRILDKDHQVDMRLGKWEHGCSPGC